MSNLNLDIHNFGPINQANIELKKLNVIAGINGSGKTTLSKLLYCFLVANSNEGNYLANNSIYKRFETFLDTLELEFNSDLENLSKIKKISDNLPNLTDKNFNEKIKIDIKTLKKIINDSKIKNKEEYNEQINNLENVLKINTKEHRKFFNVSNFLLNSEFNINDLNINEQTNINFYGKQNNCEFSYKICFNNSKIGFEINKGNLNCFTNENIIYIDSQSIFDIRNLSQISYLKNWQHHLRILSRDLQITKDNDDVYDSFFNEKLDECLDKIQSIIGGHIYYDVNEGDFLFKKDDKTYHMKNTASGVKQLGIIQILLSNRLLNKDSFLIIDEPELNLHPEWQIKFAEILILLISKLNISIYINSHNPIFIEAIILYSEYNDLIKYTNLYLTKDRNGFYFNKISVNDLDEVYENLTRPYDELDIIKSKILFNE